MKNQTTTTKHPHFSNAIGAEMYTRQMCLEHFEMLDFGMKIIIAKEEGRYVQELSRQAELTEIHRREKSKWCKDFFSTNFPHLLNCHMGKVLMGLAQEDRFAYRARTSEF